MNTLQTTVLVEEEVSTLSLPQMILTASFPEVSLSSEPSGSLFMHRQGFRVFIIAYILIWLFSLVHIEEMFTHAISLTEHLNRC